MLTVFSSLLVFILGYQINGKKKKKKKLSTFKGFY